MASDGVSMKKLIVTSILPALLAVFPAVVQAQNKLVTTQFVVVGEGLAAGMADFSLSDVYQNLSFPAQMARQMNAPFLQPLLQAPGIGGGAPGFPSRPAGFPTVLQSSVRDDFPPNLFLSNLAVPGAKLTDVLKTAPTAPLIQPGNLKQTLTNFILGYPALIAGKALPLAPQVNYAAQLMPTLLIVEVGYYDVLDAAVNNDPSLLTDAGTFAANYQSMLSTLNAPGRTIVVMTIPDPFDTAFFTSLNSATRLLGAPPAVLGSLFHFNTGDTITPNGMMTAGGLILTNSVPPNFPLSLLPGMVVSASTAAAVHENVLALNAAIGAAASQTGSNVLTFDLYGLLHQVRTSGLVVGSDTLTADYLGGFYSLDGYYPGQTGQGMIANQLLAFLNTSVGTSFPPLDLTTIAPGDPSVRFRSSFTRRPTHFPRRPVEGGR
jgi:hypothetical protein